MTKLSKKIMRRVYYAFFMRVATHHVSLHFLVITLSLVALAQVVSIPSVWANMMEVKVGEVAGFFFSALVNTQVVVWLYLSVLALAGVSLMVSVGKARQLSLILQKDAEWV